MIATSTAKETSSFGPISRRHFACAAACALVGATALPVLALADQAGGTPPDMPSDGGQGGPGGEPPQGAQPGGPGGADTMTFDYSGTYTAAFTADGQEADAQGEAIEATETDQNGVLAQNAGIAVLRDCTIAKSGDDTDGDRCNFYGANSIVLAVNEGSQVALNGCTLSATSEGSNGVFATDSGVAFVNDCGIDTSAGNSRGLDATYAGVVVASQVDIATEGDHCAAVATDRGGGTISVVGGTFSTAGSGSPLLYSTGNIQVNGVMGTASASQIAGMEGFNTILINNSELESTNAGLTGSDPIANGVIIYQSTSGDAEATTGDTATFQVASSTLKSAVSSGTMFYFTNTTANVVLSNTVLDFDSTSNKLAYVAGNDANNWGTPGSNGAQVNFTATNQQLEGDVCVDTTSTFNLYLLNASTWSGSASIEDNANGAISSAPLGVYVDGSSTWTVTANARLSMLSVASGGRVVDADGNTVTVIAGGQTVVQGTSGVTVTVDGGYTSDFVMTSANELASETYDRSAFDEFFGTSTAWTMGQVA